MHKKLNLARPKLYTEKIQKLKLKNTDPVFSKMVDKYQCRQIVEKEIGNDFLIPILGVWDHADDIDLAALPDKFVLKTTHDSGSVIICQDKNNFEFDQIKKKLNKKLKTNYFYKSREYPYKNAIPRIMAEQYMHDENQYQLDDYKFFCFDGEPKFVHITQNTRNNKNSVYFNTDFEPLPFSTNDLLHDPGLIRKPLLFENMLSVAAKLSKGIKHVRIDLYYINNKIYFGEYTFHNSGGIIHFNPEVWDGIIGQYLTLGE